MAFAPPAVGYELTGTAGAIIVEAELAWEDARIAVLRSDQAEQAPAWRAAGWTVAIVADDWAAAVLAAHGRS